MTDLGTAPMVDHVKQKAAAVELAEKLARQKMRLIAPVVDRMPELYPSLCQYADKYLAIKFCRVCDPPPKVYECPICDQQFAEKWQMQVHVMGGPNTLCEKRRKAKVKAWSNRVGLDA